MRRNISDLLDQYPAEDVELGGFTPYSPSQIRELTMKHIQTNQTDKTRKFKPARLMIAAAAAAALSVSALAAGHLLKAGEQFQDFFTPGDGALSQGQVEVIDRLGQVFDGEGGPAPAPAASNGATITPIAAIADENVYYLRLRVEAPEGVALPDLDGEHYYQFFDSGDYSGSSPTLEPAEGAYPEGDFSWNVECFTVLPDDEPEDNRKEFVFTIRNHSSGGIALNDGVSKMLTLRGLWIQDKYKAYTPVFTGEFRFDIGLNFQSQNVGLDAKGVSWTDPVLDFTNTLEYLTLSPLSLSYCYHTTLPDNKYFGPSVSISIVLKGGSEFIPGYDTTQEIVDYLRGYYNMEPGDILPLSGEPGQDTEGFFTFDEPLDLGQVDYVAFGDVKIPVAGE